MIGIRINREHWLHLPGDIELDVNRVSPVFSDKAFEENSVYNFTVPNTPANAEALGVPNRAMALVPPTNKKRIEIFINNVLFADGTVFVVKSNKNIEIVAALDESCFSAQHSKKLITSFTYGGQMTYMDYGHTMPQSILKVCEGYFPDHPFAFFPIKNLSLFNGSQWENGWKNDLLSRPYQNDYKNMGGGVYRAGRVSVSPYPYVGFVIEEIFKECGYSIEYNIFRHDDNLKRLCIYNPNIMFSVGPNREYYYIYINEHLPSITVSSFLQAIKKPFALNFSINEFTKKVSIRSFNEIKDSRNKITVLSEQMSYETSKNVRFKVLVDGNDSRAKERQQPDEIEKSRFRGTYFTTADLSSITYPFDGDIALVRDGNNFYQYRSNQAGTFSWELLCYNIQHSVIGEDNVENSDFAVGFSGVFPEGDVCYQPVLSGNDVWTVPIVEIVGNNRNRPMEPQLSYNDFDLKLMLYWGMGETQEGLVYPQGSSTVYQDGSYNPSGRFLSLFPNHDYNFIDQYLSRYHLALTNSRVKTVKRIMSRSELISTDWLETVLHAGRLWLVTKEQFKIKHSGISKVEQELTEID